MQLMPIKNANVRKSKLENLNWLFKLTSFIKAGIQPKINPTNIDFV